MFHWDRWQSHLILGFGSLGAAVLGILYSIFVGRSLGPDKFADFAAAVSVIMAGRVGLSPVHGTVTRFSALVAVKGRTSGVFRLWWLFTLWVFMTGAVVLGSVLLFYPTIGLLIGFRSPVVFQMALLVVYFEVILGVSRGTLRGLERYFSFTVSQFVEATTRIVLGIYLVQALGSALAAITAYVLGVIVALMFAIGQNWSFKSSEYVDGDFGGVASFLMGMSLFAICSAAMQNLHILVVSSLFGSFDVGLYGAAATVSRTVSVLALPFMVLLLPSLTSLYGRGLPVLFFLLKFLGVFIFFGVSIVACVSFFAESIMRFLFGGEFANGAPLIAPLLLSQLGWAVAHFMGLAGAAVGEFRFLRWFFLGVVLNGGVLVVFQDSMWSMAWGVFATQWFLVIVLFVRFFAMERERGGQRRGLRNRERNSF